MAGSGMGLFGLMSWKGDEGIGAEDWVGLRIEDLGLRGRLL